MLECVWEAVQVAAQPHCSTLITALVHPRTQSQTATDKDGIRDGQTVTMATSPCDCSGAALPITMATTLLQLQGSCHM